MVLLLSYDLNRHELNDLFTDWGAGNTTAAWAENASSSAELWSFPGLFGLSGQHDPEIVFARHDYAYDEDQTSWYSFLGVPADDLLSRIDANETQMKAPV
jgi:hypothetical protein